MTTPEISSLLPDLVDQYITARAQRLAADAEAANLKEFEEELKKAIIQKYREQGLTAIGGKIGIVKMTTLDEPKGEDWRLIWDFVKENDAFELLHKRLATTAVKERWEAGVVIPGIVHQDVYKLSVSTK